MSDYLALEEAAKELDQRMEVLENKYRGKWGAKPPEVLDPLFNPSAPDTVYPMYDEDGYVGVTYSATVEVMWSFLALAKNIWLSPRSGGFEVSQDQRTSRGPGKIRSLSSEYINLIQGEVIKPGLLYGQGQTTDRTVGGEIIYLSRREFETFIEHIEPWFVAVVCVVDESYYGRERYDTAYAEFFKEGIILKDSAAICPPKTSSGFKVTVKNNVGRINIQKQVEAHLRSNYPNGMPRDLSVGDWRDKVLAEVGLTFKQEVFRKARRVVYGPIKK